MKPILRLIFFILFSGIINHILAQEIKWQGQSVDFGHGNLKISTNHRFVEFADGTPFFYMGDTAWELFHRLDKKDAELYLENRREKGFTVIQAVALAELDGLNAPNMEGEKPLVDNDPAKPNEKYFAHLDWVIRKAAEKGMFIGLLPTWGDKVDKRWGIGPVIFNTENAFQYGKWIGTRYKNFQNIIWINGGDRSGGDGNFEIWKAIAEGIKSVDKNHLMTFHPWGGSSSSKWFQDENWLDFNMMQTGHGERSYAAYIKLMLPDYLRKPVKPTFDGEPRYEDHPCNWKPEILGWFDDADVRQAAYWNLFSGGFGHTYGCHAIWQFLTPDRTPVGFARHTWSDDLDLPGASDMINVRRLMESRPMTERVPFQELVAIKYMPETDYIVATKGKNYAFVYIPTGWAANLDLEKLAWKESVAWWYNPRTGEAKRLKEIENKGIQEFKTESGGRGNDWILVLDDKNAGFEAPGKVK
ncbi:MAG: glycoside hydrolase family 140 protein [Prolixibacteraceae bacterium]|jgi:hypothetical protein